MAGRGRLPPHHVEDSPLSFLRRSRGAHPHPAAVVAAFEDRLDAHQRDIHTLLADHQRLSATHVALTQELAASQHNLRLEAEAAARTKADRDSKVMEVYERCVRVEEEVSAVDAMRLDLVHVRSDVEKLGKLREELMVKSKELKAELARVKGEKTGKPEEEEVRAEIEILRTEIERGRAAIDNEKRTRVDNLEHNQAMEKNMISLAREVEKLRAELANAEKRSQAAAVKPVQGYTESYGNNEMAYGGNTYVDAYNLQQLEGGVNSGPQFGSAAVSQSLYDIQQSHAPSHIQQSHAHG